MVACYLILRGKKLVMMDDDGGGVESLALSPRHYFIHISSFKLKPKRILL